MCDRVFLRKIENALPIFRAGSGFRDLPPATLDYYEDAELNAGLRQSFVETEVMRTAGLQAHNHRRRIQAGILWARLKSGRDTFHLRNSLERTTHEEEERATTEEQLKRYVKFGLEKCNLFYGIDWVFPVDIDQGEPMPKRQKTEMELPEDVFTNPKPVTQSSGKTSDMVDYRSVPKEAADDQGEPMAETSDMVPGATADGEETYCGPRNKNNFYDSEGDDYVLYHPESNKADDEDVNEHEEGWTKPVAGEHMAKTSDKPDEDTVPKDGVETDCGPRNDIRNIFDDSEEDEDVLYHPENNNVDNEAVEDADDGTQPVAEMANDEQNYMPGHIEEPADGADGKDYIRHDKEFKIKKLPQYEEVRGTPRMSVIVRHDQLFEKKEHLYDRFTSFGHIEEIEGLEQYPMEVPVPEQVTIKFATVLDLNIFDFNGPNLGVFPKHVVQVWLKTDDSHLINISGKNWPIDQMRGAILYEADVPAELFNYPTLIKMKQSFQRGAFYSRTTERVIIGTVSPSDSNDRLTLTDVRVRTTTIIPGRTETDLEVLGTKAVILSSIDCLMKLPCPPAGLDISKSF